MSHAQVPTRRRGSVLGALLVILIPTALIFAGLYYFLIHKPAQENKVLAEKLNAKIIGLSNPPANHKLAARFADADGDLLADAPKDAAALLDPDTLVFSWIPQEDTAEIRGKFADLTKRLAEATGKKIEYAVDLKEPEDQLKALRDGKLHVTAFATGVVPIAVELAGFVPDGLLADDGGRAKYQMVIIVPASSSIQSVGDLRGHELALTEPTSNSGFKAPIVLLKNEHDLLPERDYKTRNTMSHDNSIAGIAAKKYEAAVTASDILDRAVAAGKIKKSDYRVIFSSADFPSAAIGHAYNLKPELAAKIKTALLAFNFKGTSLESHFASSGQTHFVPANYKNDWALVRMIDATLGRPHEVK